MSKDLPSLLRFSLAPSALTFQDAAGNTMATPLRFARTETGPITVLCSYADGSVEDLSTASSVKLTVASANGTKIVNAVSLTGGASDGTATWTRLGTQTATAGDFQAQIIVVRADATVQPFPDGQVGIPVTLFPLVGD